MARLPYNSYSFLFRRRENGFEFALFRRQDDKKWQGVSGGGEDTETPMQTALREINEEAGALIDENFLYRLDTRSSMPASVFSSRVTWGDDVLVVPIYFFAAEYDGDIVISGEHSEYSWFDYETAYGLLYWHDNKTALWELNQRLSKGLLKKIDV